MNNINNSPKKRGGGCLSWLLGTVLVIVGVIVYAVLSSFLNRWLIGARLGNNAACALLPLSLTGLTVAFVLYEAIFIVHLIKFGNDKDDAKAKKVSRIVTAACICLSLLFAIFSANTFTRLDESSITKVCFVETKTYQWTERCDVQKYALSCSAEGVLSFTVTMKDGEVIDLIGTVNSCTPEFTEKYGDLYGYAAHLAQSFDNGEFIIEKSVSGIENMEKFYKDTNSPVWDSLKIIIGE
ncbi:MAG: hypothetical protein IJC64_02830 [Clostridia bacterium]|nr:hypothetical protein [Clostridia bacterium]